MHVICAILSSMTTDALKGTIEMLLTFLGLPCTGITIRQEEDMLRVDIASPEPSRIIGWHGETLNALQHLAKAMIRAADDRDERLFLVLDVDGYRRSQEEKICQIADRKAEIVRRTGNRIALAPMSPYFRRIVHLYVSKSPHLSDLTTESIGEGEFRQIVLKPKTDKVKAGEELSPIIDDTVKDDLGNLDV